jgi:hypothetical protein
MSGPPTATALRALMRRTIRAVRDIESASQRTTYREYVHASWRRGALADTPMTARNLRNTAVEEVTWMEGLHRHRAAAQAARNTSTAAGVARTAAPPPPPPPPGRTNGEAFVRRTLAAAAAGVGAGVAYWYATDEGLRRSAKFWSAAGPIYAKYRFVANVVPAAQQEAWYAPLDKQHAPETLAIIRDLRGFYIKIGQIGSTRTDFLAREYTDSMATLQDDAPSEPFPPSVTLAKYRRKVCVLIAVAAGASATPHACPCRLARSTCGSSRPPALRYLERGQVGE